MHRAFVPLALPLAVALAASPAAAQNRPTQAAQGNDASSHFDRGSTFYSEGDYAAALIEFKRAYELSPHWQVLFNIGQSYFQLRDYANALTTLQRFASEGGERIGKDDRATLDAELPDLANRVAKLTITSNVAGATVSIDDQAVGTTPLREPVLVSAGNRKVSATYEGRPPVQQKVAVGGRDLLTVRLDFAASTTSLALRRDPAPTPSTAGQPSYAPTYVSLVLGGAGLAVGSVFGVMAMNGKSNLDRACGAGGSCPASSQRDIDALGRNDTIATIGFGVGAAGLAAGLVFWLLAHHSSESTDSPPSARAASWSLGPSSVTGSF